MGELRNVDAKRRGGRSAAAAPEAADAKLDGQGGTARGGRDTAGGHNRQRGIHNGHGQLIEWIVHGIASVGEGEAVRRTINVDGTRGPLPFPEESRFYEGA